MSYTNVTPYYAAKIATDVLRAAGKLAVDEEIAPQTMYGAARPNKSTNESSIATVEGSKPILFVGDAFKAWLDAQVAGTGRTRVGVNVNALIAEFSSDTAPEVADDDPDLVADMQAEKASEPEHDPNNDEESGDFTSEKSDEDELESLHVRDAGQASA
jgi:hypothetical protein